MTSYYFTHTHSLERKGTIAYYNLFLSNLQHNLLKFKSWKFKCLKIAEGHYEAFACVWVPLWCCVSLAADLHFSDTFKVKRHVKGLYTLKGTDVDHRALLQLAVSPESTTTPWCSRNHALVLNGLDLQGHSSNFQNQYHSRILVPGSTESLGWEHGGLTQSLMNCVTLSKSFTCLGLTSTRLQEWSIYFGKCLQFPQVQHHCITWCFFEIQEFFLNDFIWIQ